MRRSYIALFLIGIVIVFAIFFRLGSVPPLWWDEGWTVSVARNWIEEGVYGRYRDGMPYGLGLNGHNPVVLMTALSFRLFGIGVWQARLPGAILTIATLWILFLLTDRIYGRRIAYGALFILLLTPINEYVHPIFAGRQVLGEIPALFFLITGYLFFFFALRKNMFWIFLAIILWGIAIRIKAQEPYFWMLSLLIPLIAAGVKRWYRESLLMFFGLISSWFVSTYGIAKIESLLIAASYLPGSSLKGAFWTLVFVPAIPVRLKAIQLALAYCWLPIIGIAWGYWKSIKEFNSEDMDRSVIILRWVLLVFSGAWFAWYILLGMYWERYLLQANFIGAIFASALLYQMTGGFDFKFVFSNAKLLFKLRRTDKGYFLSFISSMGSFLLIFWLCSAVMLTLLSQFVWYLPAKYSATKDVAEYLNTVVSKDEIIETYESELFLFLNRSYHYPPDQVSLELARRKHIDPNTLINYDALEADPDYLVLGQYQEFGNLYSPWIESGDFKLIKQFPGYQLYKRVRSEILGTHTKSAKESSMRLK